MVFVLVVILYKAHLHFRALCNQPLFLLTVYVKQTPAFLCSYSIVSTNSLQLLPRTFKSVKAFLFISIDNSL